MSSLNNEPYKNRELIFFTHFVFTFASRMWDMGIVLILAHLTNNSLSLIAFSGLLNTLAIVLFMGTIGHYLDQTNRLKTAQLALFVKFLAISSVYILCAIVLSFDFDETSFYRIVYLIPVFSAIASLSFNTVSQCVEKDWIVVLSNKDSLWLSSTNSFMTQIDLFCNSFAPAITGFIMFYFSPFSSVILLMGLNLFSVFILYIFLSYLYASCPKLAEREQKVDFSSKSSSNESSPTDSSYFSDFMNSGCAGVMISYAFLFLTVLNFGSLMIVYLRWAGLGDNWIGTFRGFGAVAGFVGALLFSFAIKYINVYTLSSWSIFYQFCLVFVAAISFFWFDKSIIIYILSFAVLFSRTGLWVFDLGVRQIAQETIPEHCRGKVNGQWRSMTAAFEMISYITALIFSNPQDFIILTSMSCFMVFCALIIFVTSTYVNSINSDSISSTQYQPLKATELTTYQATECSELDHA